jgi:hypothetical protein
MPAVRWQTVLRYSVPVAVILGALGVATLSQAQQTVASAQDQIGLNFETASIKPLKSKVGPIQLSILPNRVEIKNLSLSALILRAFDLAAFSFPRRIGSINLPSMSNPPAAARPLPPKCEA